MLFLPNIELLEYHNDTTARVKEGNNEYVIVVKVDTHGQITKVVNITTGEEVPANSKKAMELMLAVNASLTKMKFKNKDMDTLNKVIRK